MGMIRHTRVIAALLALIFCVQIVIGANDPGHDSLYVLKVGDSSIAGNINITGGLNATLVRFTNRAFGDYLDIVANGTIASSLSSSAIQAGAGALYIDSTGNLYLNAKAGSSGIVQVGDPLTNSITVNVSGAILQQNVPVCLANGTNCLSGTNTGNISSIAQGSGITVTNPNGPAVTIATSAATCGAGEYSYWDGNSWECRADVQGSGADGTGGWADTSATTSTALSVDVGSGALFVNSSSNHVGIGTTSPAALLHFKAQGSALPAIDGNTIFLIQDNDLPSRAAGMSIIGGTTTNYTYLYFGDTDAEYRGSIGYSQWGDYLTFHTAAAERVRILSNGYMGIGTTAPTRTLDINGTSGFAGNTTYSLPAANAEVCFERFVGATQNYTRCVNSTGQVTERFGSFTIN